MGSRPHGHTPRVARLAKAGFKPLRRTRSLPTEQLRVNAQVGAGEKKTTGKKQSVKRRRAFSFRHRRGNGQDEASTRRRSLPNRASRLFLLDKARRRKSLGGKEAKSKGLENAKEEGLENRTSHTQEPGPGISDLVCFVKSRSKQCTWVSRQTNDRVVLTSIGVDAIGDEEMRAMVSYAHLEVPRILGFAQVQIPAGVSGHSGTDSVNEQKNEYTKSKTESKVKVGFGGTLKDTLAADKALTGLDLDVPRIIRCTVDFLRARGSHVEGIFRVSGSQKRIRELSHQLDSGNMNLDHASPIEVASVLKQYLRMLPEPLLTYSLYQAFTEVTKMEPGPSQLRALRLVCILLPRENRCTLQAVLNLLSGIVDTCDAPEGGSRMTSRNLALMIGPNLLRCTNQQAKKSSRMKFLRNPWKENGQQPTKSDKAVIVAESIACDVAELLIDYSDHVFVIPPTLRDDVLTFHSIQEPSRVSTILWGLIQKSSNNPTAGKNCHSPIVITSAAFSEPQGQQSLIKHKEVRRISQLSAVPNKSKRTLQPRPLGIANRDLNVTAHSLMYSSTPSPMVIPASGGLYRSSDVKSKLYNGYSTVSKMRRASVLEDMAYIGENGTDMGTEV
eukprot:m.57401 g.57401  ORF g.57401 m.57401 type:complete len:614 (+) comp11106_c0_seq1:161-2002(+)